MWLASLKYWVTLNNFIHRAMVLSSEANVSISIFTTILIPTMILVSTMKSVETQVHRKFYAGVSYMYHML